MLIIADGRDHLYQWDVDVKLLIDDKIVPAVDEVHFRSKYSRNNKPIPAKVINDGKESYVIVPNEILQSAYNIMAYAYCCASRSTRYEQEIIVVARPKPEDYVYTETEVQSYTKLEKRVKKLEEEGLPEFGEEYEGNLLYVLNGRLVPLMLGEGLEIVEGMLQLTGVVVPPESGGDETPVENADNTSKLGIAKLGLMILGRE